VAACDRGAHDPASADVTLGELLDDVGALGVQIFVGLLSGQTMHASVRVEAIPSGPNTGFLAGAATVADFDPTETEPITHPYVVADPTINVQAGHPVVLTLLLDPGTRAHATCGLVPRKAIGLPRGFVEPALARIAPSFRLGPLSSGCPSRRCCRRSRCGPGANTPTSWRDDPIEAATQFAYLPDTTHEAQEGYVRVRLDP
jgi:hypothetical protein